MLLRKETDGLTVSVEVRDGFFDIAPDIRRTLLSESVRDLVLDLEHLDATSSRFASRNLVREGSGDPAARLSLERGRLFLDGVLVMEAHQAPVMKALARTVAIPGGDVLEIGFGLGLSATAIQEIGVKSHTIVEPNPGVIEQLFNPWRAKYPKSNITLLKGKWQDVEDRFGSYTGVLADPHFPFDEAEKSQPLAGYVDRLFRTASEHLRPNGVFTYFGNHIDSIGRPEQRLIFHYFRSIELSRLTDLDLPGDSQLLMSRDYVIVKAVK